MNLLYLFKYETATKAYAAGETTFVEGQPRDVMDGYCW
jgi:hypothetical protein